MKATCAIETCELPVNCRGWCEKHYTRWRRHSDPLIVAPSQLPLRERFERNVQKTDTCWLWTGSKRKCNGYYYGHMSVNGRPVGSHVLSYELHVGPVPRGMVVDHRCHNTLCVKPGHLRACTQAQNGQNRRGASSHNRSSGLRGVGVQPNGRWTARATMNRVRYWGGTFDTIEEANEAAIALRNSLFTHNDADRQESV